jgi:hypothetical protein
VVDIDIKGFFDASSDYPRIPGETAKRSPLVRIPTMPSGHTELEASTCSDLMPSTVLR